MSISSSRLELHATDSPVLGTVDSVSVPSEPPDLRNWFPSYVYESPELNTLDGLEDLDESGETCIQEGKKGKSGENYPVRKSDDGLLFAERKSSDKILKFNKSDEFECSKSAAQCPSVRHLILRRLNCNFSPVTRSSESLPFSSEPPDIKNWFSSYVYESPPLDTTYDFTVSDYKVREDGKVHNVQKSCKQDNKDVMDFIVVEESIELATQSRTADVVVKCTNLAKYIKLDYQPVEKDVHSVALMPSQLTSEKVSKQILPGQRTGNNYLGSVEMLGDTNTYAVKLDCSLLEGTVPKLSNNIGSRDGKYGCKGRKDRVKNSQEKKDLHEIASHGTLDLAVPEEDSGGTLADRRSMGKENKETELIIENGFISTRMSSKENDGDLTRPVQVQFESSLRQGAKPPLRCSKNTNKSRKVLSETSNFLSPGIIESTGKWCCPQKNKPNLGPPLKQLRLEQWIRRV